MTEFLQFAVLGLGAGAAYALLAHGVVLVYRGSGVVNFGQGAIAVVAAYVCFLTLVDERDWSIAPAFVVAVALAAVVGLAFQQLVMRPLSRAAPIVRVVATLGLLIVLQATVAQVYGGGFEDVDGFLPDSVYDVGGVAVQQDRLILLGIAVALTAALWAGMKFTRLGLAITASAQNERATSTLGWSPNLLAAVTWTVGGALAGAAGVLIAPLTGLTPGVLTVVATVSALAAALLGGFRSFWLTLAGGLLLGIGESEVTLYSDQIRDLFGLETLTGANRAVPFLVILLVLVIRGRGLPLRSHLAEQLPRLGSGRIKWTGVALATAITAVLAVVVLDESWTAALSLTMTAAVFLLSIVVLTGFAGQLSLAQYAVGGLGALFAAKLVIEAGWPVLAALVVGAGLAVPVGLLFALPALRTRGVNLAVVTLGLGFTVQEVILSNPAITGTAIGGGATIGDLSILGWEVTPLDHPGRWALVCLVVLVLAALAVANLRRSQTGRRLVAVRTNERAAASLGISVFGVKLYAFALAAAIAALAGVLLGFRNPTVTYDVFGVLASINAIGHAVVGGLGYVFGTLLGGPMANGGLGTRIIDDLLGLGAWSALIGGVVLILLLITHQNGIADVITHVATALRDKIMPRRARAAQRLPDGGADVPAEPVAAATLQARGLSVRFGGVVAVDELDLTVAPGEVVALIGPNGAGKTTVIDAVTGFVRPTAGAVTLNDEPLRGASAARRSHRGLRRSFQSLELFEDLSVAENLHAGSDTAAATSWLTDLIRPSRRPLPPAAVAAIRDFGLDNDLDALPRELPYGRRRLVAIARTVASAPSVLLLDEPAAGLDEHEIRELGLLIRELAASRGMAVLLVEHDIDLVMSISDRIVVIDSGRSIAEGTPEQVRNDSRVRTAYLGATAPTRTTDHQVRK